MNTEQTIILSIGVLAIFGVCWSFWHAAVADGKRRAELSLAEKHRRAHIDELIANPTHFHWVWVVTGFGEYGNEYTHIFAKKQSVPRITLAETEHADAVMTQLLAAGITIHSGPPGTVV